MILSYWSAPLEFSWGLWITAAEGEWEDAVGMWCLLGVCKWRRPDVCGDSFSCNMTGKMLTFWCTRHCAVRRRRGCPRVVIDSIALMWIQKRCFRVGWRDLRGETAAAVSLLLHWAKAPIRSSSGGFPHLLTWLSQVFFLWFIYMLNTLKCSRLNFQVYNSTNYPPLFLSYSCASALQAHHWLTSTVFMFLLGLVPCWGLITSVNMTHHFLSPVLISTLWQMMSHISGAAGDICQALRPEP